jgi:hypothetical protein
MQEELTLFSLAFCGSLIFFIAPEEESLFLFDSDPLV